MYNEFVKIIAKKYSDKGDMCMDAKYLDFIPKGDIYLFNTGKAQKAWQP